jgi:nucleotide-binding universal stress UspA family protein
MFRTLVVPLDGSDLAEQAIPYAVKLVEAGRGRLILARVALAPADDTRRRKLGAGPARGGE